MNCNPNSTSTGLLASDAVVLRPPNQADVEAISRLINKTMGPGRFSRAAYRIREHSKTPKVSLLAEKAGLLVGFVQAWSCIATRDEPQAPENLAHKGDGSIEQKNQSRSSESANPNDGLSSKGSRDNSPLSCWLLGPLVVAEHTRDQGVGGQLIEEVIKQSKLQNIDYVILVGDLEYYAKRGFKRVSNLTISMLHPVDHRRVLMYSNVKP